MTEANELKAAATQGVSDSTQLLGVIPPGWELQRTGWSTGWGLDGDYKKRGYHLCANCGGKFEDHKPEQDRQQVCQTPAHNAVLNGAGKK